MISILVTVFVYFNNYILFAAIEPAESSETAKESPEVILLVGVLVGLLGTITLGLIGALIIMARRRRQSTKGPSLLVHDE